jgi:hypothetical protein
VRFHTGQRVRLNAGHRDDSKVGTVASAAAPLGGRGKGTYAVHWDGERTVVPGYKEEELRAA